MKITKSQLVSVDVGGTFCDASYVNGDKVSSLKILSNSRLRATILSISDAWTVCIKESWSLPYPQILQDCICFQANGIPIDIKTYDPLAQTLHFYKKHQIYVGEVIDIGTNAEAPVFAAHLLTGIPMNSPLKNIELRIGTTKGTNALLELRGAPCVWITNEGFKDLLYIKTQQRPDLFQLNIPEPNLLHNQVIETKARVDANGLELQAMNKKEWERIKKDLPKDKNTPLAISLIHSYQYPEHERILKKKLRHAGYTFVSVSSELLPIIHFLPRSETAVCNAYLSPILHRFVDAIQSGARPPSLYMISSAGQAMPSKLFHPKDSLLSGPAGGIKAAENLAQYYGINKLITFDMGGTSTDTARVEDRAQIKFNTRVGDIEIASPSYEIETVAAGGGSIIDFEDGRFLVGPKSAGADPGPACYGKGGPFTITDLNLLLSRLVEGAMSIPIFKEHAMIRFDELLSKANILADSTDKNKILYGIAQIANEKMAEAIRKVTMAKGHNPSQYNLLVYGGAGGLHACALADILNISTIIIPYTAGIFSATGIGIAPIENIYIKQINLPLSQCARSLPRRIRELYATHRSNDYALVSKKIYLKYLGQNHTIEVDWIPGVDLKKTFEKAYKQQFGFCLNQTIEVDKISITTQHKRKKRHKTQAPILHNKLIIKEKSVDWSSLSTGKSISGPAIIYHHQATVYIEPDWSASVQANKDLILSRKKKSQSILTWSPEIESALFGNRFKSIAEQMGVQLQHSAFSVNVKERLDFSCALLDPKGRLLANAPHIPVHLGSLGISARLILKKYSILEGDIILCNHPLYGGSHLPDLTLLKGVFDTNHQLIGYVINRAHHAEIGGMTPGSMPPFATNLEQEGVVFAPTYIQKNGKSNWPLIRKMLQSATYPTRDVSANIFDLKAAMAALHAGELRLKEMVKNYGLKYTHLQMSRLLNQGTSEIQKYIKKHDGKRFTAIEKMDDGRKIKVSINMVYPLMIIDFAGTGPVHPGNLNANPSIVWSVVLYVLRLLCEKDINLNEGLTRNVKLLLPTGFLSPFFPKDPAKCPAVVGGNTEVSQRLTDTLIKALELAACSQGTMNNFLFGDESHSYYETIGGGVGAGPGFEGRSAVHQHMTNTKITDPEELEVKYPVILDHFSILEQSGGEGQYCGGNGISRKITFLKPMTVTILAQHRIQPPYGLRGGDHGQCGQQFLIRGNAAIALDSNQSLSVEVGDSILIKTPGGGGWGKKTSKNTLK